MNGRPPPQPLPPAFCRDRLAAWAAERLPALRAEPIPPCRHPGVTLLLYAFPAEGRIDLFEFAIRHAWSALGALPTVVVTHDPAIVPPLIRDHEPRLALDGGLDGLRVLRQIILDATQALRPGGRLFLEIGDDQGLSVRRLLERAGYADVVIARDLAGHDRYAEGSLP